MTRCTDDPHRRSSLQRAVLLGSVSHRRPAILRRGFSVCCCVDGYDNRLLLYVNNRLLLFQTKKRINTKVFDYIKDLFLMGNKKPRLRGLVGIWWEHKSKRPRMN